MSVDYYYAPEAEFCIEGGPCFYSETWNSSTTTGAAYAIACQPKQHIEIEGLGALAGAIVVAAIIIATVLIVIEYRTPPLPDDLEREQP